MKCSCTESGTAGSPQHDGSGVPGTNEQCFFSCCGYFLAAAYRSRTAHRGQAPTEGATHVPLSLLLLLVRAACTSTRAGGQTLLEASN